MRRGDVCTVAGGPGYTGKPRPAAIVQHDGFVAVGSRIICGFTTEDMGRVLFRIPVLPSGLNGLHAPCWLMIDKMSAVPKEKIGATIGRLSDAEIVLVDQAIIIFLGLVFSTNRADRP